MSADLALALVARGIRSIVLCLDAAGEQRDRLVAGGVEVVDLGGRRLRDPRYHARVARVLHAMRADAVHTHMFAPLLFTAVPRRLAGIPALVHTEHSLEYLEEKPTYRRLLRWLARGTTSFVVLGERMRRYYADRIGVPPDRLRVIPNGVVLQAPGGDGARRDARRELGTGDGFVVGAVGRLAPEKNLGLLLRAFARATAGTPDARLALIGDGTERAALERLAADLGIAARVVFAGWRRDVPRLLPALDVLALSSHSEGLPLAVLEAMAAGIAVVATAVGDIPDVVRDGETGRLVPAGDEPALAAALDELRRDPERRGSLGRAGRALVAARYSRDAMVNAYVEAYGIGRPRAATA